MRLHLSTATRALAGASALVLALPAAAQVATAAPQDADEILVTAQRLNETGVEFGGSLGVLGDKSAEDVPFSIRSYNAALILNQQPQTLGQVLENDPSVRTSYGFANASEQFVIRGFELFGDDVGFDGLYGIVPRQLIAPELYESVQVLNGASAFLNGAPPAGSAVGGTVNLIPKRAGRDPLTRVTVGHTFPEHFGGGFDVGRRFGANGEWGVRVNGAVRAGDLAIDDEYRSSSVIGAAFDYNNGPLRLSLDVAYQRVRVERQRPKVTVAGVIPEVPDADTNYGQPWQETTLRDVFGEIGLEYDLSENAMVYADFGARDGLETGFYTTLTLLDPVVGTASATGSFIPRTDNNEAARAGMRIKLPSSVISHEINLGGSMNWLVNRNAFEFYAAPAQRTNIYDPVTIPRPSQVTFVGGDLDDPFPISRIRLGSVFASDTLGFWDDRILLTGGLRLQNITVKSYSNATRAQTGEYSEDAVTPIVGLVIKPAKGVSLYANRSEALVQGATAPNSGANPTGGANLPVTNAGEVLPPFVSEQYEIGAKLSLEKVSASVAVFQIDRERAILRLADAPGFLTFGPFGTQRNRGVEFSVEAEPVRGLRIIGGASVIDAKLRRTQNGVNQGNQAVGVPEYLINGNVEWDVPFLKGFTLTGRVVQTGEQAANLANTLFLPDWTRVDLGARYVALVNETPVTLRFGVDNVANERYWASAFDTFRPDLLQGQPRTFRLSVSTDLQ